jgi:hypothetical protein
MRRFKKSWGLQALSVALALCLFAAAAWAGKKVIFFTSGRVPTAAETAQIKQLNEMAKPPLSEVQVVNGSLITTSMRKRSADYIAGTIPNAYRDGGLQDSALLIPVLNPASPPTIAIPGGGLYTITSPDGGT